MIVTCESCRTKFRLDPSRLKGPKNKVRCSRCKHVFFVAKQEEGADKVFINLDEPGDAGMREDPVPPPASPPERETLLPPRTKTRSRAGRTYFWAVPLGVVVLAVLVGIYYFVFPSSGNPPPEKTAAVKEEDPSAVTISTATQAYFVENSHVGQLFVVEGEVINAGEKPVNFVLLEGKLLMTDNKIAQSQKCFAGNPMNKEELATLAINDIQNRMMNRECKDMANVNVVPQGRVRFTVVFHNLPEVELLSDYSVEVLTPRAQ